MYDIKSTNPTCNSATYFYLYQTPFDKKRKLQNMEPFLFCNIIQGTEQLSVPVIVHLVAHIFQSNSKLHHRIYTQLNLKQKLWRHCQF